MGMVSGGQLALEALLDKGGTKVFNLSGGQINPLYESAEGSPSEALHGYLIRS
jgi:thiamine pyrophosphate-dependent acetolactate synthase large subunit-like protein